MGNGVVRLLVADCCAQQGKMCVMSVAGMLKTEIEGGYAGDVLPEEAWHMLQHLPNAILVDVRCQPEWLFSGTANLASIGKEVQKISWKHYPTMEVNPHFVAQVQTIAPEKDTPLLFLCKTGGRSLDAAIAMSSYHYTRCYNVLHGFEGDQNPAGQRGGVNGWKASGLPWEQA